MGVVSIQMVFKATGEDEFSYQVSEHRVNERKVSGPELWEPPTCQGGGKNKEMRPRRLGSQREIAGELEVWGP